MLLAPLCLFENTFIIDPRTHILTRITEPYVKNVFLSIYYSLSLHNRLLYRFILSSKVAPQLLLKGEGGALVGGGENEISLYFYALLESTLCRIKQAITEAEK